MTPRTKFTFFHASLAGGQLVVNEPIGWKGATVSLERDEQYHSLVEYFKGNFMWFGRSMTTLKDIEAIGLNEEVRVLIELTFKTNGTWETLFDGLIKISQLEEIFKGKNPNKLLAPVIRNDFWAKFINRYEVPVNLEGAVDVDGNARTPIAKETITMPSQKIRHSTEMRWFTSRPFNASTGEYFILDWETVVLDEVQTKYNYYQLESSSLPFQILTAAFDGDYAFEVSLFAAQRINLGGGLFDWDHSDATLDIYIQKNNDAAILFTATNHTPGGGDSKYTDYTYSGSFTLAVGDVIRIYGHVPSASGNFGIFGENLVNEDISTLFGGSYPDFVGNPGVQNFLEIVADTTYPTTTTDAFLIKEAFESVISKYVGADDVVISTKFDDATFNQNGICRGKHVRGWSFSDKQFSASMKELWEGSDPVWNLGLGYTKVLGVDKIEIEDKAHFYNQATVVDLDNCNNLVRRYDLERFFKAIELGYQKWSAESASGIDDPQTKRIWRTALKTFGRDYKYLSKFLTASLAIERTRRNRVELGKDDRLDEDIILMALLPDGGDWVTEFSENYDAITGLINEDFRINLRHTVSRIFRRWQNFINPSLPAGQTFDFAHGEGNYSMTSQLSDTDYEATDSPDATVAEDEDFVAAADRLWVNEIYELKKHPMSWETYKTIRDNKNNAIGISVTEEDHTPMFIINLDHGIFEGSSSMLLLKANNDGAL